MQNASSLLASSRVIAGILADGFECAAEKLENQQLVQLLVEDIRSRTHAPEVLVMSLIGGAASGKSELCGRLLTGLRTTGLSADSITVDDYNLGDRLWRRAHFEGASPARDEAILEKFDRQLLGMVVNAIRRREPIQVPKYNELTGVAVDAPLEAWRSVGPVDVLIIEGDFDLVPCDFKIYLHMDDQERLANRVRRDTERRGSVNSGEVEKSFMLRQEIQHFLLTLPAANTADVVVTCEPGPGEWTYDLYAIKKSPDSVGDGNA